MTAEDNGVPEDDDPFAYLYRGQEGEDARNAAQQPGAPRTSYQQATQVGRMQYGQPRQQPGGQQPPQYQQQYQQQQQVPPQQTSPLPPVGGGRAQSRSGGSSRAVTYGAIGVVLAVVVGIGVALLGGGDKTPVASPSNPPAASASTAPSTSSTPSGTASAALPGATNVSGMTLGGGAVTANNHTGAASTDGKFVPLTASGMSITWSSVTVPTAGSYTFWVHYANAGGGGDNPFTLTVNGKALPQTINLKNWAGSTSWDQAWQRSYSPVTLNAGSNTIEVSYGGGSNAGINVDQLAVTVSANTPPWP